VYAEAGKIETLEGQFDKNTGTISFRATFPNPGGLLRSGNTGKVRITTQYASAVMVPQEATFELQDKVLVYAVADSNKVVSRPLQIAGRRENYYFVEKGLKPGDRIVLTGLDRLHDGVTITPQPVSMDSLRRIHPL
jgi:membrane fusion protein, multidrug efflux system